MDQWIPVKKTAAGSEELTLFCVFDENLVLNNNLSVSLKGFLQICGVVETQVGLLF